jgi:hypothetical protein
MFSDTDVTLFSNHERKALTIGSSSCSTVLFTSTRMLTSALSSSALFTGVRSSSFSDYERNILQGGYTAVVIKFSTIRSFQVPNGTVKASRALLFVADKHPEILYVAVGVERYQLQKEFNQSGEESLLLLVQRYAK